MQLTDAWLPVQERESVVDLRDAFSGTSGNWPEWFHPVRYPQVFGERYGFLPNLSVLDLLFCCGRQGGEVLKEPADVR